MIKFIVAIRAQKASSFGVNPVVWFGTSHAHSTKVRASERAACGRCGRWCSRVFCGYQLCRNFPRVKVTLFEKGRSFLSKVRISGGGRCNVTHACFDPRELSSHYPRGGSALLGPFQIFQSRHTIEWFEARGVKLKTEEDGRIFPVTDSSQTVIDCLMRAAKDAGVDLIANRAVQQALRGPQGCFELALGNGDKLECKRLMLALGGCRAPAAGQLAVSLGHTLESPVPSLFTFHTAVPWLRELAGISVPSVDVSVPGSKLPRMWPVLITHTGLAGQQSSDFRLGSAGTAWNEAIDSRFDLTGCRTCTPRRSWRNSKSAARHNPLGSS